MLFEHKARKFDVCGEPIRNKWLSIIYPLTDEETLAGRGLIVCEPHATNPSGPFVLFDSEEEAVDAARTVIIQDLLRD